MARLRSIAVNTGVVLAAIALTLLLAEGVLRVLPTGMTKTFAGDRGFFSHFDLVVGWRPTPEMKGVHSRYGFAVEVEQNRYGLRAGEDVIPARQSDRYRALILGDSYVWGFGVGQHRIFTDPAVYGEKDLQLINFGVSGYGTDQELLWYSDLGTKFDVNEVVLVITTYNDIANNMSGRAYGYDKPQFVLENGKLRQVHRVLHDQAAREWLFSFMRDSKIGALLTAAVLKVEYLMRRNQSEAKGIAAAEDQVRKPEEISARDRQGLKLTAAIIGELDRRVRAAGARLSVAFVPYKIHVLAGLETDHPFVPILENSLTAMGIPYFDPYAAFLAEEKRGPTPFNKGDNHFSPTGHALFAKELVAFLRRDCHARYMSQSGAAATGTAAKSGAAPVPPFCR